MLTHRAFAPACLFAGLALRLAWVLALRSVPVHDGYWYYLRGVDFALGRGYTVEGVPTAFWPVGYPAFLGLLFAVFPAVPLTAHLANVALAGAALVLMRRIALILTGSLVAANLTLMLLAFHPNGIACASLTATEPLYLALLLAAVALMLRGGGGAARDAGAGALFGLVCLVKPQAVILPALLAWLTPPAGARARLKRGALVYAALALILAPWILRNAHHSGRLFFISTNGGYNLFVGNNPYATGSYLFTQEMGKLLDAGPIESPPGVRRECEVDRWAAALARDFITHQPRRALALLPRKLLAAFRGDVDGFYYQGVGNHQSYQDGGRIRGAYLGLVVLAEAYYLGLLGLFAVAAAAHLRAWRRGLPGPIPRVCWVMIAYLSLLCLVFFGIMRYHYPIVPWLALGGAAWLAGWLNPRPSPTPSGGAEPGPPGRECDRDGR